MKALTVDPGGSEIAHVFEFWQTWSTCPTELELDPGERDVADDRQRRGDAPQRHDAVLGSTMAFNVPVMPAESVHGNPLSGVETADVAALFVQLSARSPVTQCLLGASITRSAPVLVL